jgi:hypothetical protein
LLLLVCWLFGNWLLGASEFGLQWKVVNLSSLWCVDHFVRTYEGHWIVDWCAVMWAAVSRLLDRD